MLIVPENYDQHFAKVVRSAYPALLRLAQQLVEDWAPAEDLVQEALLQTWRDPVATDFEPGALLARLKRAVIAQCKRQDAREPVEALWNNFQDLPPVAVAFLDLDVRYRQVLDLMVIQGLSFGKTARILHLPKKELGGRLGIALRHLREDTIAEEYIRSYLD